MLFTCLFVLCDRGCFLAAVIAVKVSACDVCEELSTLQKFPAQTLRLLALVSMTTKLNYKLTHLLQAWVQDCGKEKYFGQKIILRCRMEKKSNYLKWGKKETATEMGFFKFHLDLLSVSFSFHLDTTLHSIQGSHTALTLLYTSSFAALKRLRLQL